jgi:two-component system, OmpR family, phosphate regulon sensor histidine kinase PhoR
MNKRETHVIMILFTVSMTGFLLAQIFWIRGAFHAMDETFRQINGNALKNAAQQVGKSVNHHELEMAGEHIDTSRRWTPDTLFSVCRFEAVMKQEFGHYDLHKEYEFGIIDHLTGKLYLSSAGDKRRNLILQSRYRYTLKQVMGTDRFSLVVWFPFERMIMLQKQNNWLLVLSLLLFLGIVAGYILTSIRLFSQKRLAMIQKDFINNTTHELKTPLAAISVAAELLLVHRRQMPESQIDKYVTIIYDENKRLQRQVDQILQVSLLEEETYTYHFTLEPLKPMLDRALEIGKVMLIGRGGEIHLQCGYQGELMLDKLHVSNVFNNLIENAIKYSQDEPQLSITVFTEEDGVYIKFTDKGIGISPDQIELIFDRMYRIPAGALNQTQGTGIGLYYVKKVIEAHQGSVHVNSLLGEGSCFEVFLPYNQRPV